MFLCFGRQTSCLTSVAISQSPVSFGGCHPERFTAGENASSGGRASLFRVHTWTQLTKSHFYTFEILERLYSLKPYGIEDNMVRARRNGSRHLKQVIPGDEQRASNAWLHPEGIA